MRLALTFDVEYPDRPHANTDGVDQILDVLAMAGARATFFVEGRWALAHPESCARIVADCHLLANHSHHHMDFRDLDDRAIAREVQLAADAIATATGRAAARGPAGAWFRLPYLAGADDPRVLAALDACGAWHVHLTEDTEDYTATATVGSICDHILASLRNDPAVVLLHSWPRHTPSGLAAALPMARDRGAELVTVDEIADALPAGAPTPT